MPTRLWSVELDSAEPAELARWWSTTLGWPIRVDAGAGVVGDDLSGDDGARDWVGLEAPEPGLPGLGFARVPEGHRVKNRVHLDLASRSAEHQAGIVEELIGRGATRLDIGQGDVPWVVLADPEGNELCVLEPRPEYGGAEAPALAAITLDARSPAALAPFWSAATGWQPVATAASEAIARLAPPGGGPPFLELIPVADAKSVKNRVHLDVAPFADDDRDAEVARLVSLGARPVDVGQGPEVTWVVLADPEGNELCVLRPR